MANLTLRDGAKLAYRDEGSGRPVLFLHGWGMRGDYFDGQLAALAARFRVIVPDLRGHGASSPVDDGHGFDVLVEDVMELFMALGLDDVTLVGWSMGAMLSWGLLSGRESGRITSLVTVDMVPRLLNDEQWQFGLRQGRDAGAFSGAVERMRQDWPAFTRVFVPRIFAKDRLEQRKSVVDRVIADTEMNDPASMVRLWNSMVEQDFREALSYIEIPCLVTYGALSQLYSEAASSWVAGQLRNAHAQRFAESGHAPHLEETDLFNDKVMAFAEQSGRMLA